jgi:hypothetical protein
MAERSFITSCISWYRPDRDRCDALVEAQKRAGLTSACRSSTIRTALAVATPEALIAKQRQDGPGSIPPALLAADLVAEMKGWIEELEAGSLTTRDLATARERCALASWIEGRLQALGLIDEVAYQDPKPECPGQDCPACNGEQCWLCGAGCWSSRTDCKHDVIDRHDEELGRRRQRRQEQQLRRRIRRDDLVKTCSVLLSTDTCPACDANDQSCLCTRDAQAHRQHCCGTHGCAFKDPACPVMVGHLTTMIHCATSRRSET